MEKLDELFERLDVKPPQTRQRKTNYGTLGKWLGKCGGDVNRLVEILDELHSRGKLDTPWSYTWTMVQVWAEDGPPPVGSNGGRPRRGGGGSQGRIGREMDEEASKELF